MILHFSKRLWSEYSVHTAVSSSHFFSALSCVRTRFKFLADSPTHGFIAFNNLNRQCAPSLVGPGGLEPPTK